MAEWRQFVNKQRQKRAAKGKRPARESIGAKDEIIVQRMSSEVTGKQQKYTRIGPRESVPFEFDEITFDNIVEVCQKYFAGQIDKDMVCDILAGERGPSCKQMCQIPDHKVFYVRFINMSDAEVSNDQDDEEHEQQMHKTKKTRCDDNPRKKAVSVPSPKKVIASKFYPESLSIQDMQKLGKVISKKSSTVISIYKFDFEHMQWSNVPMEAEFLVAESPFASGGFRRAFKATSITEGFEEVKWVVKKYLKSASEIIKATNETEESHTKKSVQMHYLARNFASQLKEQIEKEQLLEFGPTFELQKVFMGKTNSGEFVSIEEYIDGDFIKYINNNGDICEKGTVSDKAEAFVHLTHEKSEGKLIVLDIQGAGYTLYDPEIASLDLLSDDGTYQFCTGNLSEITMKIFFQKHQCNKYCKLLGLKLAPS